MGLWSGCSLRSERNETPPTHNNRSHGFCIVRLKKVTRKSSNKDTELYALIDGPYKICIPEVGDKMKLFDLENDPSESKDLSHSKPHLFEKMKAGLEKTKKSWQVSREGKDYTF